MSKVFETITDHEAQIQSALLSFMRNKTNRTALLQPVAAQIQELENVIADVLTLRLFDGEGVQLDQLGDIVGQPRQGRSDEVYKLWLAARILLNLSSGTPEQIIEILAVIIPEGTTTELIEYHPAGFTINLIGEALVSIAFQISEILQLARAAGVDVDMNWSLEPEADTFTWNGTTQQGWNSGIWAHTFDGTNVPQWFMGLLSAWTQRTSGTSSTLRESLYYAGKWFVCSGSSVRVSEDNGVTWTSHSAATASYRTITQRGGLLVMSGGSGKLVTSDDEGVTWTERLAGALSSNTINKHMYAGGQYILCANTATVNSVATSPDAITWTLQNVGTAALPTTITYGAGLYAICHSTNVRTSPDGITWTLRTTGLANTILDLYFGGGLFLAGGAQGILGTSPDGITWSTHTSQFGTTQINLVRYVNGVYLAVGNDGKVSVSQDGATWAAATTGFTTGDHIVSVGVMRDLIVIGTSNGKVAVSSTGYDWTIQTTPLTTQSVNNFTFDHGRMLASGSSGAIITCDYSEGS